MVKDASRPPVLVVVGAGGMGLAIARRSGRRRQVVLADRDAGRLTLVRSELAEEGLDVSTHEVDITSADSVAELARAAAALGPIDRLAHTAGVSPTQASSAAILAVDLMGTALVLESFEQELASGGAGVFIASMAGHLAGPLGAGVESLLASTAAVDLPGLDLCRSEAVMENPAWAYMVAKRANQIRVRAVARDWGARGLRVNSISPGVIATEMGNEELDGSGGDAMRQLIDGSALRRAGTAEEIAGAAHFLLTRAAGFVTGTDLLVDGGVVASL